MAEYLDNPWKGLDSYSFSDSSSFFGRSKEIEVLFEAIVNNRFTILYGPSGVGKTSLINAGISPKLVKEKYFVVNISMRSLDLKLDVPISNRLVSCVREQAKKDNIDITPLVKDPIESSTSEESLWCFFHMNEFWSEKNELLIPVVIIDQFEDVFKDGVPEAVVDSFFDNLDELSCIVPPLAVREQITDAQAFRYNQSADFHVVFSLREDYIPRLDDFVYSKNISELRKSRCSITQMNSFQAREVILFPSKGLVTDSVADKIIKLLSSVDRRGSKIEPFLLSLFMYRVFIEMKKRGLVSITEELINNIGSDIVNEYYLESMGKISKKAMKYIENVLLTSKGHRDSISVDRLLEGGKVSKEEMNQLLSDRILKKTTVNNVDRIEFTHDVLSKYAQLNKNNRKQGIDFKVISGLLGAFVAILLAIGIGKKMNVLLTYISMPILLSVFTISAFAIVKNEINVDRKRTICLVLVMIIAGILIDLAQIIPGFGYCFYAIAAMLSLIVIIWCSSSNKKKWKAILTSILVWLVSFAVIPSFCYGYNIAKGLNYAHNDMFFGKTFYIKDGNGKYGLRNKDEILVEPQFDTLFIAINNGYVVKRDNKYGMVNKEFEDVLDFVYDGFRIEKGNAFFYSEGKEIAKNGIGIKWNPKVKETQKEVIRKIVNNMILVEGGTFEMGTDARKAKSRFLSYVFQNGENIMHQVVLTDYYMNKYEVTLEDWKVIMEYDARFNYSFRNEADTIDNPNLPVYKVTYEQCESFVEKIKALSGLDFSLPSEAQWEYAARGGKKTQCFSFSGANNCSEVGWIKENSGGFPHAIGCKKSNELGFFDMTGNVAEFCKDCLSPSFYKESDGQENPCCEMGLTKRNKKLKKEDKIYVIRGGSFLSSSVTGDCLVTKRNRAEEGVPYKAVGFRLALNY